MGETFEDGPDRGRILVSGHETGGAWSLMEYVVAPGSGEGFGAHRHREIEETFYVRSGKLQFLLDEDVRTLQAGDVVRVAPGQRHGFANRTDTEVELLVSFHPGGFEALFVRHRSDQDPGPSPGGFMADAMREFASEFEDAGEF